MNEIDKFMITINSDDATLNNTFVDLNGNSVSDTSSCTFNFYGKEKLKCSQWEQFTFSIVEALLPLSYYNINENNNTIVISNDSRTNANGTYIITKGNYAVSDLYDVLLNTTSTNSQVCATSGGIQFGSYFTVSFDTIFLKFTFQSYTSTNGASTTATLLSSSTTASRLLGFNLNTNYSFAIPSGGTYYTLYSSNLIDLSYTTKLLITCDQLLSNALDSNNVNVGSNVLISATAAQNSSTYMVYSNYFEKNLLSRDIQYFTLNFLDQDRNKLNLNGLNWSMTILIKKYRVEQLIKQLENI